ncbi:hypothetical protein J6590_079945 [Homalodisca vitripennis]|nr:hypothetical protein J6590_079945 [Homalodisca vitripennis]
MGDNRMPRIALEKEEGGRRPRGRPRGRWEDQVWKDIERRGLQKIQVEEEETWNDRQKWRRLCTTTRDNGNEIVRQVNNLWVPLTNRYAVTIRTVNMGVRKQEQ